MTPEQEQELFVVERRFSEDEDLPSIALANFAAVVPDVEANKDKMLRVLEICKQRNVNVAIFPEFSLSGYFWEGHAPASPHHHPRRLPGMCRARPRRLPTLSATAAVASAGRQCGKG